MRHRRFGVPVVFTRRRRGRRPQAPSPWQRRRPWAAALAVVLAVCGALPAARAARTASLPPPVQVSLVPSQAAPQPVGTRLIWFAVAHDSVPLVYQFSVASSSAGPYTVVRDFSPHNTLVWTPLQEGAYSVQVTIKEGYSGAASVSATASYTVTSRVSGGEAVVTPMPNPLVALYSAPPCASGQIMVAFRPVGSPYWTHTNPQPCLAGQSRNVLVAGMTARTTYLMAHVVLDAGSAVTSTASLLTTGALPRSLVFPSTSVPLPPSARSDTAARVIVHEFTAASNLANPLATDLSGRVVWYSNQADLHSEYPFRIEQVGSQLGDEILLTGSDSSQNGADNVLRVIDLAGDPVQETNVQVIDHQLMARGQRIIYGFSHDALVLPNGDLATYGYTQQVITTTPVMGDSLIVLDKNLQVVWTWDAFQHLDPTRGPTLGDTCGETSLTCPVPGGPGTIDWTHANAIDYTPTDGNLLLSLRNQDWVIKINYANGSGDGSVLWRLGPDGDFRLVPLRSTDPYPWFSHQHDANFVDAGTLAVFDNGNTRCAGSTGICDSRGQVYVVNEQTMVARQIENADLGSYSSALGTAQRLSNGNYNFTSGAQVFPPPAFGQEIEVRPDGTKVYIQRINNPEYRAWRLNSLYSTINPACSGCLGGP